MALKIEAMEPKHLGDVRRLFTMMGVEHLTTTYPRLDDEELDNFVLATLRNISQNPYAGAWVAVRGHKVIAFLMAEIQTRPVGKPHQLVAVHWLYVHPRHRQFGIARRLLNTGLQWARQFDVTHAEFCAIPGDTQWEARHVAVAHTRYVISLDDVPTLFAAPKVSRIA